MSADSGQEPTHAMHIVHLAASTRISPNGAPTGNAISSTGRGAKRHEVFDREFDGGALVVRDEEGRRRADGGHFRQSGKALASVATSPASSTRSRGTS
jgi:hypothetical protein